MQTVVQSRPKSSSLAVNQLLEPARTGCLESQRALFRWVYEQGLQYFRAKVSMEAYLNDSDAEDLAGDSLLEF